MLNTKYVFKCRASGNLYKPEYMFDVEGMRKHPEYQEVDADGNEIDRNDYERVQRPLVDMSPVKSAPVKAKKK